jgi:energy-converting hydrogenase Eha subunit B
MWKESNKAFMRGAIWGYVVGALGSDIGYAIGARPGFHQMIGTVAVALIIWLAFEWSFSKSK